MKRLMVVVTLCLWTRAGVAGGFKPYPGAKHDKKASAEASKVQPGTTVGVYMTSDAFDKVASFYRSLYKEYAMPAKPPKIMPDRPTSWAFFTLDGGNDLANSKHWMKVQRPSAGAAKMAGGKMVFSDVRDATVIEVVLKH